MKQGCFTVSNVVPFPEKETKVVVCAVQQGDEAVIRFAGTREEVSNLLQVIVQEAMNHGKKEG